MKRIAETVVAGGCLAVLTAATLSADVKTEEKGHVRFEGMLGRVFNMFGGKAAKEGVVTRVAVKGDRKMSMTDRSGQLIDLAEEKIYDIDFNRKSYKVTTFEEIRQKMREAQERARRDQEKARKDEGDPATGGKEYEIDVDVKQTGETKTVNGFDTRQVITTVTVREKGKTLEQSGGMVLALDSWLTKTIPSMKEVQEFDLRYMQKLHGPLAAGASAEQMAAALAMYPMLKDALAKVNTEGAKADGTPVATTLKVEAVKSPEQMEQQSEQEASSSGGLGGMLARKMMKKKTDEEGPKDRATVMTTTHEVLSVSTEVAPGDVAIPAGFKEK